MSYHPKKLRQIFQTISWISPKDFQWCTWVGDRRRQTTTARGSNWAQLAHWQPGSARRALCWVKFESWACWLVEKVTEIRTTPVFISPEPWNPSWWQIPTNKQTNKQTSKQTNKQTNKQTTRWIGPKHMHTPHIISALSFQINAGTTINL